MSRSPSRGGYGDRDGGGHWVWGRVCGGCGSDGADSHWVRWHGAYEDPSSGLSARLRAVQSMLRAHWTRCPRVRTRFEW